MGRRSYKAARREALGEPVEFDYEYVDEQGADQVETFTCRGKVDTLMLSEFAHNAEVESDSPEGMALLRQFFADAFGDEAEYKRFFRLHTKHGDDDLLFEILGGLVEDFAGRPKAQPSSSSTTPSTTGPTSRDDSSSADLVVLPGGFQVQRPTSREEATEALEAYANRTASSL